MSQEQRLLTQDEEPFQSEEPEFFDRALLLQPPSARQEYFEQQCLIEHPRLLEALEAILQAICSPGDGAALRRPGTMILVIGPSRVGKTTLIRLLEARLLAYSHAPLPQHPHSIPLPS